MGWARGRRRAAVADAAEVVASLAGAVGKGATGGHAFFQAAQVGGRLKRTQ